MKENDLREKAEKKVAELKDFYQHLFVYIVVNIFLNILNWITSPEYWWAKWPLLGWGIGITMHGVSTFGFDYILGKNWEERKIKEIMEHEKKKLNDEL